jgi:hypothetical protein
MNCTDETSNAAEVQAVAVVCPFCNIMLTDGMKQRNVEDKISARCRRAGREEPGRRWSARPQERSRCRRVAPGLPLRSA